MFFKLLDIFERFSVSLTLESLDEAQLQLENFCITDCSEEERVTHEISDKCSTILDALFTFAHVPSIEDEREGCYDQKTFSNVSHKATVVMSCFETFLRKLSIDSGAPDSSKALYQSLCSQCLLLCVEHVEPCMWTSDTSLDASSRLLQELLTSCDCTTPSQLLVSPPLTSALSQGLAKSAFSSLLPHLTKATWKNNPASVHTFKWCLQHISFPHLSDHLDYIFPISLSLVDDFEVDNKVLGVACLQHIVANVSGSELALYGRAEVLYEALQHQLYTHDPLLLDALLPCLLNCLIILEPSPQNAHQPRTENRFDTIVQRILTDMDLEQQVKTRRVYSHHLPSFIDIMGIVIVRHMSSVLRMIGNYLEIPDYPDEEARLNTLECLNVLVQHVWPRLHHHEDILLKHLLKLIYDCSANESQTSGRVTSELLQSAIRSLVWLRKASSGRIDRQLDDVLQVDINQTRTFIEQAMNQPLTS